MVTQMSTAPARSTKRSTAAAGAGRRRTAPPAPAPVDRLEPDDELDQDAEAPALTAKSPESEAERVTVFTLDGVQYTAPAAVPYSVALRYLRAVAAKGAMHAELVMLERLLGPEGVAALESSADLTQAQYRAIVNRCTQIMLGSIEQEAEQGN